MAPSKMNWLPFKNEAVQISSSYQKIMTYELKIQVTSHNVSKENQTSVCNFFPGNFEIQISISSHW